MSGKDAGARNSSSSRAALLSSDRSRGVSTRGPSTALLPSNDLCLFQRQALSAISERYLPKTSLQARSTFLLSADEMFTLFTAWVAVGLLSTCTTAYPYQAQGNATRVQSGQSIQSALDAAEPGTRIIVEAGVYAEQLNISTDGISLVGEGAVLVPPDTPTQNLCTGIAGNETGAGICVSGSGIELGDFDGEHQKVLSVGRAVSDVSISGFFINGFDGENIAVYGGSGVHVTDNSLYNGGRYGVLTAGSNDTVINDNVVISEEAMGFIAVCIDNQGSSEVLRNQISRYYIGLCIQSPDSQLSFNDVSETCVGASLDPAITGIRLLYNHFGGIDPVCATEFPFRVGIFIYGAISSVVSFNVIEGQMSDGQAAGIGLVDAQQIDPSLVASNNTVSQNVLLNNDYDIYVNTTGMGNKVVSNQCSTPEELCT